MQTGVWVWDKKLEHGYDIFPGVNAGVSHAWECQLVIVDAQPCPVRRTRWLGTRRVARAGEEWLNLMELPEYASDGDDRNKCKWESGDDCRRAERVDTATDDEERREPSHEGTPDDAVDSRGVLLPTCREQPEDECRGVCRSDEEVDNEEQKHGRKHATKWQRAEQREAGDGLES